MCIRERCVCVCVVDVCGVCGVCVVCVVFVVFVCVCACLYWRLYVVFGLKGTLDLPVYLSVVDYIFDSW